MNIAIVGGGSIGGLFAAKMVKSESKHPCPFKRKDRENSDDWHYNSRIGRIHRPNRFLLSKYTRGRVPYNWESSADLVIVSESLPLRIFTEVASYLGNPKQYFCSFKWNWLGGNSADKFGKSRVLAATTTHAAIRQKMVVLPIRE